MAPGGVRADEHQEVGLVQVLVAARHGVGAEGPAVRRHRGRHAEPRIGVDVGRADEALRQLVGDVVILGEQLAREVERHRIRSMRRDGALEPLGHRVERFVPGRPPPGDLGVEDTIVEGEGFAERRALRAQPAEIRRVLRIARDARAPLPVRPGEHAAADAAIRAGGADGGGLGSEGRHVQVHRGSLSPGMGWGRWVGASKGWAAGHRTALASVKTNVLPGSAECPARRFDSSHPRPHPEVRGDLRSRSLEGGLQGSRRFLEPSFEVSPSSMD